MSLLLRLTLCALLLGPAGPISAQSPAPKETREPSGGAVRSREFAGEPLPFILSRLAAEAGLELAMDNAVLETATTVTIRLENVTALDSVKIIAQAKGLYLIQRDKVLHVFIPAAEREAWIKANPPAKKSDPVSLEDFWQRVFGTPMLEAYTGAVGQLLLWEARPETAERTAKVYRALLDALLKEGFSREEAMRIVERYPLRELPNRKAAE